MKPWKRTAPTVLHKVGYRTLVTKHFVLPGGAVVDFQVANREDTHCIATVALTKSRKVVIARQFRPGPEKIMDELPGGGVEPHDNGDFAAAAARELREETGYVPGTLTDLGYIHKDAYNNTRYHYFLAEDCEPHPDGQQLDEHEHVEVRLISIAQLFDNARNAKMTDTEAVFLAYDRLLAIQQSTASG